MAISIQYLIYAQYIEELHLFLTLEGIRGGGGQSNSPPRLFYP